MWNNKNKQENVQNVNVEKEVKRNIYCTCLQQRENEWVGNKQQAEQKKWVVKNCERIGFTWFNLEKSDKFALGLLGTIPHVCAASNIEGMD